MKNERLAHLKIKIATLAFEATVIRHEERKRLETHRGYLERRKEAGETPDTSSMAPGYWGLHEHRTGIVRWAARHNLLAYAFLRGRSYAEVEAQGSEEPDWDEVKKVALRFEGDIATHEARWVEWVKAAKEYRALPVKQVA